MMQSLDSSSASASRILTINGGSSSVKFAVFSAGRSPSRVLSGQIDRTGTPQARLTATRDDSPDTDSRPIAAASFAESAQLLVDYLKGRLGASGLGAIGHRLVRGGPDLIDHQLITPDILAELRQNQPLDLAHLPNEIALIEEFGRAFPEVPQVACFDTAFHRDLPRVAQLLPIPRRFFDAGVRRFGFHGLSYTFLMSQLEKLAGKNAARGRVVLAHLGAGASMAAVRGGKPIDTTMSFTPTAGLVMARRPGDLDPGLLVYLMRRESLSPDAMDAFLSHECGMLGVSDTSSDVRDLLAARASDPRAADAVDLFCYEAKKHLCAMIAALGGIDTLVFAGGIGEHSSEVRAAICDGLTFLGLELDQKRNAKCTDVISGPTSRVIVRVTPTDEEVVIAQVVLTILSPPG